MKVNQYLKYLSNQQYQRLNRITFRYLRNERAEDAAQNACLSLLKSEATADNINAYTGTTAASAALLVHNRNKRISNYEVPADFETLVAFGKSTEQPLIDEAFELKSAIAKLPAQQQTVIKMHLDDKTYTEIAAELGISYNTVKANYRHGMLKLKELLNVAS